MRETIPAKRSVVAMASTDPGVLADSLARYKELSDNGDLLDAHIATMSDLMRDRGLDTSLTEVYLPPS
jgi:hypothetical protein